MTFCRLAALAALAAAGSVAWAEPPAGGTKPPVPASASTGDVDRSLNAILEAAIADGSAPAMAALVVRKGDVVEEVAVGRRSRNAESAAEVGDLWHIGSCTKSMTATLTAMLVADGTLRWDLTLAEAFPMLAERMQPALRTVTIEQLLRMRGGIPGEPPPAAWIQAVAQDGTATEQRRRFVEQVLCDGEAHQVGAFEYSNQAYAIVGVICEQAAGEAYEALLIDRLARPLGMDSLGFGPPGDADGAATSAVKDAAELEPPDADTSADNNADRRLDQPEPSVVWGHRPNGNPAAPGRWADNPPAISPAGRVHLSLADWAKYLLVHLEGESDEEGASGASGGRAALGLDRAAFVRLHEPPRATEGNPAKEGPPDTPYAMGWIARDDASWGRTIWHNGSNTMWYGEAWLAPEHGAAVIVVCNQGGATARRVVETAMKRILEREAATLAEAAAPAPSEIPGATAPVGGPAPTAPKP